MNRREALTTAMKAGACSLALPVVAAAQSSDSCPESLTKITNEKEFISHWLSDLIDGMGEDLSRAERVRLFEACGRACFRRHEFKRKIAEEGCGSVEKLLEAYNRNFEAWQEDDGLHIRYGAVSKACYCPVAQPRPPEADDLHCECTKATHAAVVSQALGREVHVDVVETLRRGGKTCHFVARV